MKYFGIKEYCIRADKENNIKTNKKFWKELICLLSSRYLNQDCPSGSQNFLIFLYFIHERRKLNSLQRYDIAQNYRILHRVVQRLSQHNSKFRTIAIFKNCVKQNND
jgi:uncharacterized membrane protein YukC